MAPSSQLTTEEVYIDQIAPLVEQIINLAFLSGIPLVFAAHISDHGQEQVIASYCKAIDYPYSADVLREIERMLTPRPLPLLEPPSLPNKSASPVPSSLSTPSSPSPYDVRERDL